MIDRMMLASGSPRRIEILTRLGFDFSVKPQEVDESFAGLHPADEAVRLAEKKVRSCLQNEGDRHWILGADTFVVIGSDYIVKPADKSEARSMIKQLSGNTHQVITGLALNVPEKDSTSRIVTSLCRTEVTFSPMDEQEIEWYIETEEWHGVAAAYRIQGKGALFIEAISGSYSNVMGLPINTFYGMLRANNFNFRS